jgi:hypothetical protein
LYFCLHGCHDVPQEEDSGVRSRPLSQAAAGVARPRHVTRDRGGWSRPGFARGGQDNRWLAASGRSAAATIGSPHPPGSPPAAPEDPHTAALQTDVAKLARVVSCDPQTGKFYIHPGGVGGPVLLQGEPVRAPTELRPGDTIRAGDFEFRFLSRGS